MKRGRLIFTAAALFQAQMAAASPGNPPDYPFIPVPFTRVSIDSGFWSPRLETNREVTVWYDFEKCEETGRIANFARAGLLEKGEFQGIPFNDSDVYKVIEGAAYSLALKKDPRLDAYLDDLIAKIAAAQEEDGYLYTARTNGVANDFTGPERWSNLRTNHELYNVGHLYEAAVAHYQATGKETLLDVALYNADLIADVFGPESGQLIDVPGHEEIEIGLVKLYRATGRERYLNLARFFVNMRGRADLREVYGPYCQDHVPAYEQTEAVGHAVRAGYLYAGMADLAALTGVEVYGKAVDRLWQDIVYRKMHLTGGIGARRGGEAFGEPFELPNASAYLETCAAIAFALFDHRMFLLRGDGGYLDVLERILYNGFLSGVSASGDRFFYPNPLAWDGRTKFNQGNLGRAPWFNCSCCPVNIVRFLPSVAGFVYAQRWDDLYVNLYMGGSGIIDLSTGRVKLTQTTQYPWEGRVEIKVEPEKTFEFALKLRIPGWSLGTPAPGGLYSYLDPSPAPWSLTVNGEKAEFKLEGQYAVLLRDWKRGDRVVLDMEMPIRRVLARPEVEADRGRVALERGPIVYCLEAVDHGGKVAQLMLPDERELVSEWRADLLGGVMVLSGEGSACAELQDGSLVQDPVSLTAIPYYAWAERELGEMTVWIPRDAQTAVPLRPETIASAAKVSASHVYHSDTILAINDRVEPAASGDHELPRFTWWDHLGTDEWLQYDFKQPAEVSQVELYWFDDSGRGQCRVPESWRLLYRDGKEWRPVRTTDRFGVELDRMNSVSFEKVETDALRIEVKLQPDFSSGVLEWKVR